MSSGGTAPATLPYMKRQELRNKESVQSIGRKQAKTRNISFPLGASKYDPIPKFDNKSATDLHTQAVSLGTILQWGTSNEINPDDFDESQLDFENALKTFRKELEVPSKKKVAKHLQEVTDPEANQKWKKYFQNMDNAVLQEASIYHAGGVAGLAWIPEDTVCPTKTDPETKKLLGEFSLKV